MTEIQVDILKSGGYEKLPEYKKLGDSGMDVVALIDEPITLKPLERKLIPTGIKIGIPEGFEIQVRPRSGMAFNRGLSIVNTPGTIDSNYRGEIGIIAINLSNEIITIEPKERIAQLVLQKVEKIKWNEVNKLSITDRGEGGYGSTGLK